MNETTRPAPKPPLRRTAVTIVGLGAAATLVVGAGLIVGLRREIARVAVSSWLNREGVQTQIRFDALTSSHLTGALVIGPPAAPVLVAPRVDADFSIRWSIERGVEMRLSKVRLVRPHLHAWLGPKGLSFGDLDPLLRKLGRSGTEAGPRRAAPPDIEIRQGDLMLTAAAGTAEAAVNARLSQGRLARLTAELSKPATLRFNGRSAALDALSLRARSLPDGSLAVDLETRAASAQARDLALVRPTLAVHGVARLDPATGALRLMRAARVTADAEAVRFADAAIGSPSLRADLTAGEAAPAGGRWTWRLTGDLNAQAARAHAKGVDVSGLNLALNRLSASGIGTDATAVGQAQAVLGAAAGRGWRARAIAANAALALDGGRGSGRLHGGFAVGDAAATGAAEVGRAALRGPLGRALEGFGLTGRRIDVAWSRDGVRLSAVEPIAAHAPGASASLASHAGAPLLEAGPHGVRGGFLASVRAGDATASVDLTALRITAGRLAAEVKADAKYLTIGPVRDGRLSLDGTLAGSSLGFSFTARRCLDLAADRVAFGPDALTGVAGRICPSPGPLLATTADGWRASGRVQDMHFGVPTLQLRAEAAEGQVAIAAAHRDLEIDAKLEHAKFFDLAGRFRSATASGSLALRAGSWRGDMGLSVKGEQVAELQLADDLASNRGTLSIVSGPLTFRRGGLQPDDLTPLAASLVGSPVEGTFAFRGGFAWSRAGVDSSGQATVRNLNFRSPLGAAKGAALTLDFTSLAPLTSRPAQPFEVARINSFVPLTAVKGRVQLLPDRVRIEAASAKAADGRLELEQTDAPFAERTAWTGALDLHQIRTDDLMKASPFADKIQLSARLDGRLPFVVGPKGVSFVKGHVEATAPGRLSISRDVLTGGEVAAAGSTPQATPNAMQSIAYQALEDLAFSKLGADVNSLPGGRLGVLFHVKGRHEPAHPQRLELPLAAALRGQIADKPLPLPAGTQVDLTLDTSLNFDELERDFVALRAPAHR